MKAVIEIDLEIDGKWRASDRETLESAILESPEYGVWEIEEGRLCVLDNGRTVKIKRSRHAK